MEVLKIFKRKTKSLNISERDPEYKVRYLGNVVTAFVKGEGCVDKPTQVLMNNYVSNCNASQTGTAGLDMEMRVCASGLKVITKEQGLTEYRAHRITYSVCPQQYPKLFVWVYRHDGKKLKPEVRCHAVLCKDPQIAHTIAAQLQERCALALKEFRREKERRQHSRLLLARCNSVPTEVASGGGAVRTKFLATGQNFRPSIDRSTSAPKLGSISEGIEEEPFAEDAMSVRRRSLLSNMGRAATVGGTDVTNSWLTEEYEGDHGDLGKDLSDPIQFSVANGDNEKLKLSRHLKADENYAPKFINESLTDTGNNVTDVLIEMFPDAGIDNDSDGDSTESGFSEQDGSTIDS